MRFKSWHLSCPDVPPLMWEPVNPLCQPTCPSQPGVTLTGDKWPVGVTSGRVWSVTSQYPDLRVISIHPCHQLSHQPHAAQGRLCLKSKTKGFHISPRAAFRFFSLFFVWGRAAPPAPVSLSVRLKYFSWDIRPRALDWLRWPVFCALNCPSIDLKFSNLSAPNPQWSSSFKSSDWVIQHLLDYKEIAQKLNFWSKVRLIKENDECPLTRYLASNLNSYFMKISYLEHFLLTTFSKTPKCHQNPKEDPQRAIKILEHQKLREMMAKLSEQAFIYFVPLTGNYRWGGLLPDWAKQSINSVSSQFFPE